MDEIKKKLDYLLSLKSDNPRIIGHTFTLMSVLRNDEDYEKKLEYLKSIETDDEYMKGQIEALEWVVSLKGKSKTLKRR
jgi:hypothetical protein